jgi:methylmalonyl-CoA carboxyltransferase large subunit
MATGSANTDQLKEALETLLREVERLGERVAALEQGADAKLTPPAAAPPAATPAPIGEELLVVITAAVAAFLGKKPHVRQIRLVGTTSWAQQGRATIQASHSRMAWHGRDR